MLFTCVWIASFRIESITKILNFICIHLVAYLGKNPLFFSKMATIFRKKVKTRKKIPYFVKNAHIYLHFQFQANPANGFESTEFQTKMNKQLTL